MAIHEIVFICQSAGHVHYIKGGKLKKLGNYKKEGGDIFNIEEINLKIYALCCLRGLLIVNQNKFIFGIPNKRSLEVHLQGTGIRHACKL